MRGKCEEDVERADFRAGKVAVPDVRAYERQDDERRAICGYVNYRAHFK